MTWTRCQGYMATDHCLDMEGSWGPMWTTSWRCVNCGRLHDCVIEQNSEVRHKKVLTVSSSGRKYEHDEVPLGAEAFIRAAA
jgi:hypothetical protein